MGLSHMLIGAGALAVKTPGGGFVLTRFLLPFYRLKKEDPVRLEDRKTLVYKSEVISGIKSLRTLRNNQIHLKKRCAVDIEHMLRGVRDVMKTAALSAATS